MRVHQPVLFDEVMAAISPRPGGTYVDGTVGAGGHAAGILALSGPDGRVLGLDLDVQALELAGETLSGYGRRVTLVQGSFVDLGAIAEKHGFCPADGVLLDLGISMMQLTQPQRGFSFSEEGPLDMRYDRSTDVTAADLVNSLPERELADILFNYGEEGRSRRIARAIVQARPLRTTAELADLVARVVRQRGRLHPATRAFLALRIAVNDELAVLEEGLKQAVATLAPGAKLAVIAFHSLEDRIVKHYLRAQSKLGDGGQAPVLRLVTPKPLRPSRAEQERNVASRSAKLRVAERLPPTVAVAGKA
jgi:16S rRNA (cytosine1402-N4)-methyltransferase